MRARRVPGQIVTVEIIEQPSFHTQPIGRVVEVLGNYGDPGMEIEIALRKHALPFVFSPAVERRAKAFRARSRSRSGPSGTRSTSRSCRW